MILCTFFSLKTLFIIEKMPRSSRKVSVGILDMAYTFRGHKYKFSSDILNNLDYIISQTGF